MSYISPQICRLDRGIVAPVRALPFVSFVAWWRVPTTTPPPFLAGFSWSTFDQGATEKPEAISNTHGPATEASPLAGGLGVASNWLTSVALRVMRAGQGRLQPPQPSLTFEINERWCAKSGAPTAPERPFSRSPSALLKARPDTYLPALAWRRTFPRCPETQPSRLAASRTSRPLGVSGWSMEPRVPYWATAPALITLAPDATPFRVISIRFFAHCPESSGIAGRPNV